MSVLLLSTDCLSSSPRTPKIVRSSRMNGHILSAPNMKGLLLLLLSLASAASGACYYPNGRLAPNDTPCRDNTDNAVCCGQGYACLSNGLCQATGKELQKPFASEFVRGGCTDKSFRSSSCPLSCINPDVDNVGGGQGVGKCEGTDKDMYYCINANVDAANCTSGDGILFFAGKPSVITTIGVLVITTTDSKLSETEPDVTASVTLPHTISTTATGITTEKSNIESATTSAVADGGGVSSSNGAIIGGAVGGGLMLVIFFLPGWWVVSKRRARRTKVQYPEQPAANQSGIGRKPVPASNPICEAPGAPVLWKACELTTGQQGRYAPPPPQELPTPHNQAWS